MLYVDDYDRNETLSTLKQCSCGRDEDDGRQLTRQPQINVYYSTAVSYIRTRVRTFSANNTFYTSVGSETGLKKRILFCPTICGLENKRSRSTRYMTVGCSCGLGNERSRSTRFLMIRWHSALPATVSGTKDPDP